MAGVTVRAARAAEAGDLTELALRAKASWGYDAAFMAACRDELTMTPSQYVQRNCYLASELAPFDSGMIDFMGPEHIMWGSDYPHEEGFTPHSKLAIRWALHNRSEVDCRKILGGNAGRLYRFDLDALAPVAAKIGPTVAEVHTPLDDTGYRAPAAFGYRPFEGGLALKRLAPARS